MANYKMIYGDSFWIDVTPKVSIDTIDSNWPGTWAGRWTVKEALTDETPLEEGALILFDGLDGRELSPGKFRVEIDRIPENSNPLPIGDYILSIEITNELTEFRREVAQDALKVSQDGV